MYEELQEQLGYSFAKPGLLELALTTPAFRMDHPDADDNQRLEFLGDAVFGILSAESLYETYPWENEGALTVRRTKLASGAALAEAAEKLGVRASLKLNKGAAELPPNAKPLADAMEAILGAIWLDGGIDAARRVYAKLWDTGDSTPLDPWSENPKGHLQIIAQAQRPPRHPAYETLSVTGPSHDPTVVCRVTVPGLGEAEGQGRSHRAAEVAAATELLRKIEAETPSGETK